MTPEHFSTIAPTIPALPGIYKYYNAEGVLIYVGKAKHLRKRISSYFSKTKTNYKTVELVNRIARIEFTIVNNESDAFLLENALIKEHQPFYNISLKDDKTYPYIVVKREPFPRVFFTRKKLNDGSLYFGPYTSIHKVKELLEFIKEQIPLRSCKLPLTPSNIAKKKFKVCLEYHLGNCKGPCEGLQSAEDYALGLEQIKDLLRGNLTPVMKHFKEMMKYHAGKLEFEKAAYYNDKIQHLIQYQSRSVVVNSTSGKLDVFSILEEGDTAYVNYLGLNDGMIVNTKTITLQKKLEESADEVLRYAIVLLRETFESEAAEIVLPFETDYPDTSVKVTVPKGGDKKKLIELSLKNVNFYKSELDARKMLRLEDKTADEKFKILQQLQADLRLKEFPEHIECFDNSNVQGSFPVAAMVYFKQGEPEKDQYRVFNIKTVQGINDFASMKEVVFRRYYALQKDRLPLPQLVIIDGGKGQLSAAMESIRQLGLEGKMTVVGLAKNKEEIFYPGDSDSLILPWNSESLKLIRRIRDEVHRTAITFHRNKRSKGAFKTRLEEIDGIGKQTIAHLLKAFKSVKNIEAASVEQIEAVVGKARARLIVEGLQSSTSSGHSTEHT
ncbi:MAG TPA: excinuclease ABC subunit UvrC [Ferruginibacter sp.]|nr:excinuclease ABC subunit UvrC [Ferruginibacter sp.]HRO18632.1 excinuclease ABC subunit UvrC [Ferruginibacter sp.]HRQ21592.1 excinuclease ABC subunit UvrC [Ferruginibacter sp.]